MMHASTVLTHVGGELGFGVIARERIPAGTVVWVMDQLDRAMAAGELERLPPAVRQTLHAHVWREQRSWVLSWDHCRFTNHSCEPNCVGLDGAFDLAVRDIEPGEAITNDYGALGMQAEFTCQCGAPSCRGFVRPGTTAVSSPTSRAYRDALARVTQVPQPLVESLLGDPVAREGLAPLLPRLLRSAHPGGHLRRA